MSEQELDAFRSLPALLACCAFVLGAAAAIISCHDTTSTADNGDAAADGETGAAIVDAGAPDVWHGNLTKIGAGNFQVSVTDSPAWPESNTGAKRLGYLRAGAIVPAYDRPIINDDCKAGWYELESGGYVCGNAATLEINSARVKRTPKQPDTDAGMPYRYGVNLGTDTPLYRRVLNTTDRAKYEPWLAPKPAVDEAGAPEGDKDEGNPADHATLTALAAAADDDGSDTKDSKDSKDDSKADSKSEGKAKGDKRRGVDAGGGDKGDAGPPKLKELKGHGVLVRRMARGFYLALDRDFKAAGAHWWRTTFGFAVPFDRVMLQPGVTKHHGAWFDGPFATGDAGTTLSLFDPGADASAMIAAVAANAALEGGAPFVFTGTPQVAFVTSGYAHKVTVSDDGKPGWGVDLPRRTALLLTGREIKTGGGVFQETTAGYWVRPSDLTLAHPQIPPDLAPNEKWIDVDLTRQALVAYEGLRPVFATLISSGRRNPQDKEKDFPTPQGTFHIREKHVTTTMDGDVASDGPYSIEDVPWVMYFEGSYALHGAFWHDQFGWKRSHGCVNMAPEDARQLFAWSDPPLPVGWHGVFAKDENAGTRLVIHEDAVAKAH